MATERRALVKVTLGWERVYEFELWIMDHGAGVDVVLGTDFMIPAGVRLDMFHATAKLPGEVSIPLIKTKNMLDERSLGPHINSGPAEDLLIPGHEWVDYRPPKRQPSEETHELWIRRTETLVPTVKAIRQGKVSRVRVTNVSDRLLSCRAHTPLLLWVPIGDLPYDEGYTRLESTKYREWQVAAFEESRDEDLLQREYELYQKWLAAQPPAVDRPSYPTPAGIKPRPPDDLPDQACRLSCAKLWERELARREEMEQLAADGSPVGDDPAAIPTQRAELEYTSTETSAKVTNEVTFDQPGDDGSDVSSELSVSTDEVPEAAESTYYQRKPGQSEDSAEESASEDSTDTLEAMYLSVATALATEEGADDGGDQPSSEHMPNEINLEDYAHELAFLPDLTETSVTDLDYSAPNVRLPGVSAERQDRVVEVLKKHEKIMISSGNALPPPAYGVVCDIDVNEHSPIKQRARRVPLRHLRKLYELLRGLLKAGLIAFSNSPWASPIVIVLKKNGEDIRLCIDYKMVNAITAIMEYAMPLVDDLLTDLEKYLWYCSLDAARCLLD
ncbi:uncharacterized protein IUM83_12331 [Phytophthora cinnamomi]|uniref:uncharacterized protein n=1 Tax=Phytophthora cinnamomi TaxID=4785 RepID=UPI0035596016|nr:hypothetical protein IUM83_12331 [Phytophthora cinnamomi]